MTADQTGLTAQNTTSPSFAWIADVSAPAKDWDYVPGLLTYVHGDDMDTAIGALAKRDATVTAALTLALAGGVAVLPARSNGQPNPLLALSHVPNETERWIIVSALVTVDDSADYEIADAVSRWGDTEVHFTPTWTVQIAHARS